MINVSDLGKNYISALRLKYLAQMEEAKANLTLYANNLTGIGEHSDLLEEYDKWIDIYSSARDKLESLNELFGTN
jgi:hypothetical protein